MVWVSQKTFDCLNHMRSDMFNIQTRTAAGIKHHTSLKGTVSSRVEQAVLEACVGDARPQSAKATPILQDLINDEEEEDQDMTDETGPLLDRYGFCHQCKQVKSTFILAECKYSA